VAAAAEDRTVRRQGPAPSAREDHRERQAAGPPTVLVVDDDPRIVALLIEALAAGGYRVLAALGAQALRLAREARPAVVLLDLQMPQMDGAEVCRRLRAEPATAAIPIVLMSADERLGAAARALAVDDQLPKPFKLSDLFVAVARWAG
jgi:CheY-like chemotaxis protein